MASNANLEIKKYLNSMQHTNLDSQDCAGAKPLMYPFYGKNFETV